MHSKDPYSHHGGAVGREERVLVRAAGGEGLRHLGQTEERRGSDTWQAARCTEEVNVMLTCDISVHHCMPQSPAHVPSARICA